MKNNWNYIEKDGNPKTKGRYIVVLIYDGYDENGKTEEKHSVIDIRYYGPAFGVDKIDESSYTWITENPGAGGYPEEVVWAWMPLNVLDIAAVNEILKLEGIQPLL